MNVTKVRIIRSTAVFMLNCLIILLINFDANAALIEDFDAAYPRITVGSLIVDYDVSYQWGLGFVAQITAANSGDAAVEIPGSSYLLSAGDYSYSLDATLALDIRRQSLTLLSGSLSITYDSEAGIFDQAYEDYLDAIVSGRTSTGTLVEGEGLEDFGFGIIGDTWSDLGLELQFIMNNTEDGTDWAGDEFDAYVYTVLDLYDFSFLFENQDFRQLLKDWQSTDNTATTWVPLPGAIWLLGSGLMGMIGICRKSK